ncbi:hypothetical protein K458DRAFT_491316 [Lentithecium fluviatile CBS 122367]|uniref:Large ribosomal subunit protein P1 n=1 Tax=Lentithecium fluviatile CBS 122367 TaxID=1168545 RepID=A0A6G1IJU9_9PLEO|nr:hypothetical protein K458DRAFT_491316 [Lentithecium fluviatile CBS 122367]
MTQPSEPTTSHLTQTQARFKSMAQIPALSNVPCVSSPTKQQRSQVHTSIPGIHDSPPNHAPPVLIALFLHATESSIQSFYTTISFDSPNRLSYQSAPTPKATLSTYYHRAPPRITTTSMSTNATTTTGPAIPATASTNKAETAVSYAALILADANVTINPDKLQALLKAANVDDVEPIWTTLFAKALEGKDIKDILTAVSTSGGEAGRGPVADEGEGGEDGEVIVEGVELAEGDDGSDMEGGMFDLFG